MANFKADILDALKGEPVEGISIGKHPRDRWGDRSASGLSPADKLNRVLPWSDVEQLLDYEYHDGFGGEDCHPIYLWTATRVFFIHEYDGSTCVRSVPRNPIDVGPQF